MWLPSVNTVSIFKDFEIVTEWMLQSGTISKYTGFSNAHFTIKTCTHPETDKNDNDVLHQIQLHIHAHTHTQVHAEPMANIYWLKYQIEIYKQLFTYIYIFMCLLIGFIHSFFVHFFILSSETNYLYNVCLAILARMGHQAVEWFEGLDEDGLRKRHFFVIKNGPDYLLSNIFISARY